ncbi:MAG: TM0106 family RecB-like putative nuclease [Cyanobacteria bacterium J055]|nr:MAG: TM0106 family RecB-like putative nuclease [Cyanobacteria bacterium J055]
MLLTAELLLFYQRCARRAFLDVYGDSRGKEPESDFLLKLHQDSRSHRQSILASHTYHQPDYNRGNWRAGMHATVELMRQGVECIYQGVLTSEWTPGVTLLSLPDLLVKEPGNSEFGDWIYVPQSIKLGKRSKLEYQIAGAFDAQVLANVQGAWPPTAWLLLRKRPPYAVSLEQRMPQMHQMLSDCISMLRDRATPEVFISRQRCNLCPWYGSCYRIAQQQHHLSLLPGITPNRYEQLRAIGVTTLEALIQLTPARLTPLFGAEMAEQLITQARSTFDDRAIFRASLESQSKSSHVLEIDRSIALRNSLDDRVELTPADLNGSSGRDPRLSQLTVLARSPKFQDRIEIHFDLEAEPELDIDFMFGVLIVDRDRQTETFYPLVAEQPEEESQIWEQFLDLVWQYPRAPIFHFCDYEVKTTSKLAKRYKTPRKLWQPLMSRFVDIHWWTTQTAILPVESYALKPIARWLGFQWRDASANGAQCICWYNQWLETGDRAYLDAIVQYNEDDCRATYQVKEWLVKFWLTADSGPTKEM